MTEVIQSPHFLHFFNTIDTSPIIGAINSVFNGGACLGSLMGGFVMDRIGRRWTIQMGAIICLFGAILQTAAQNLAMMLVGRVLAGWAVGLMSMSVPVYQSECAHPKTRGFLIGITQQMIGVGFIVSTWVGYGSSKLPNSAFSWRFPLAFQVVPCAVIIFGLLFFPESPRQLVEKDRAEEALQVLRKLHFNGQNEEWILQEFNEIKATIEAEKAITAPGWKVMFTVPQWRTRLMHATLMQVFTQFTGINVFGYYATIMYKILGITGSKNLLVTGIYNVVGPVTNLFFIWFLSDRVGRRRPLLFGTVGITVALICVAVIGSRIDNDHPNHGMSIAGVFFVFCVTVIFSLSFGPISWTYASEVMPMPIRARGSAFATGIGNWLVSTFWAQVSPIALGAITWKFYFIFIAFNTCITFPTIYFVFKETKQLSLEEIDLLFGERALGALPKDLEKRDVELVEHRAEKA
ncbi:general substrate transporter [Trichodelitschia bisporula]|uniref:General substrate transporter n=1 Tax=Trichodelitschia bisporula TaxID=703511 RepID=A0A6G1I4Y2_9PEZI|nr:general substrate transporter [Trichodelitschia bisporula]